MDSSIMVLAVPMFFLLILVELYSSFRKKSERYNLNDSINNISTGILEEVASLPMKSVILLFYTVLYTNYGHWDIDESTWQSWVIAWLGVDFCYYWFHRCSHRCTFLWTGHSVHHQSTYYNLSVALRQGVIQAMTSWVFFLPLALLGVSPLLFATMYTFNTLYQFWIHTQCIKRLSWFELIFNTPSHHRVHHGTNPQYIDKNYAGSLIIWDKLFGTFAKEEETVNYGVTDPLDSWNPFYANIKVILDVTYYIKYLPKWYNKLFALVMPPEWVVQAAKQNNPNLHKPLYSPNFQSYSRHWQIGLSILAINLYFVLIFFYPNNLQVCLITLVTLFFSLYWQGKISNGNHLPVAFLQSQVNEK